MSRARLTDTHSDVLIAGAGPTGVTLATMLAQRGVSVRLVERHHGVYPLPRAVHLDGEVYRILHDVGVGEAFSAITRPTRGLQLVGARHRLLARFERGLDEATGLPQANLFDQPDLERLLRENLARYDGVALASGEEIIGLEQSRESVAIDVRDVDTFEERMYTATYVVGCDGANSIVRELAGITQKDLGFEQRWLVVDIRSRLALTAWDGVHQVCNPRRAATYMRIGHDRYRWEFRLLDQETPADYADLGALRTLIEPWASGVADEHLEVLRAIEYTFRARVAGNWRAQRVFIAGDAAHLTPPFIGQGMCAGMRDAANLAWKLSAVLDGHADDSLLDSYQTERKPHATALINRAVGIGKAMTGGGRVASVLRWAVLGLIRRIPGMADKILHATTPAITGPLVDTRLPKKARGTLLPLVRLDAEGQFIDRYLGLGHALVAVAGCKLPPSFEELALPVVYVAADSANPGERDLAQWLHSLSASCALLRPDHVVQAISDRRCNVLGITTAATPITSFTRAGK